MKLRIILVLAISSLILAPLNAQRGARKADVEQMHKERTEFFIKDLKLTEKEQKEFIPLMEEYIHVRFDLNRDIRESVRELKKNENRSSEDFQKVIDLMVETKIKEAELRKQYFKKFSEVLPAEKVLKYERAEMRFMEQAVKHYRKRNQEEKQE